MSKKITLFILLFLVLFSCSGLEDSRGDINALTIISSKEDRDYCEHIIRHFFENKFINTPQKEYVYNINWMNLLRLAIKVDHDQTMKIVSNIFGNLLSNFTL